MAEFDRQEALTLYLCGMTVTQLAQDYGVHRRTVRNYLVSQLGPENMRSEAVPPPVSKKSDSDTCPRGHSLADAVPRPNGARECRECKKARQRAYKKRKNAKKKEER